MYSVNQTTPYTLPSQTVPKLPQVSKMQMTPNASTKINVYKDR